MLLTRLSVIAFVAAAFALDSPGELYDVACPSVNSELKCPEGHTVNVLKVNYGAEKSADCSARNEPAQVSDEPCIHPFLSQWFSFTCKGLERCLLPKPEKSMFVCDHSEDNFIQITYNCLKNDPHFQTAIICHGKSEEIECDDGDIKILTAKYGRFDENICTATPTKVTYCSSYSAHPIVKARCDHKDDCILTATDEIFGKPEHCEDQPAYLHVNYVCH